jgi:WD40-like Beta Propeller Repeat
VRRHAKASLVGSTDRQAACSARRIAFLGGATAVLMLAVAIVASPAGAAQTHPFLETFGSAAQPSFSSAIPLAVDQSSGDVLVGEGIENEGKVRRFHADGTPANFSALGTNVIDGLGPEDATPQSGLAGFPPSQSQIAIDESGIATDGDIYVTQASSHVVDVFASTGAYLGQLTASSEGALGRVCGAAVDSAGTLYVAEFSGKIHKYVPSGNPVTNADNTVNFEYEAGVCNLAAGIGPTAGFIFAVANEVRLSKLDASTGEVKYNLNGGTVGYANVSVDPSNGHVYALGLNAGSPIFREFDASGVGSATLVSNTGVEGTGWGLAVRGSTGSVYISRQASNTLDVFGPAVSLPTLTVEAAGAITPTTATLHGTVNPEGVAVSECKFEYGPVSEGFPTSVPCEGSIPTDSSDHAVSATIGALKPNETEYHFRIKVTSDNGPTTSAPETFATQATMQVNTGFTTVATGTEATVEGTINPEGNEVTGCRFEYGTLSDFHEEVFPYSVPCEGSIPTDSSEHTVTGHITGLPGDGGFFVFRLVGTNVYGDRIASPFFFILDTTAVAEPATNITQSSATLNGSVKTDGQPLSDCQFEYGTDGSYGQSLPCNPEAAAIPVDLGEHPVSAPVGGLQESTTYYFRVSTTNAGGTVHSAGQTFQTPGKPQVTGESAIANQISALIGGYIDPRGSETTYRFEWGATASYGNVVPAGPEPSVGSGSEPVPVETRLSGLEVGQAYHFRLVATNSSGTVQGPDGEFTTYKPIGLPDNRHYEQVSPPDKGEYGVEPVVATAAVDGNRLLFLSKGTFAGQATALAVEATPYLATRGTSGWTTEGIGLPNGSLSFRSDGYMGFNPDMSKGVIGWLENSRFGPYDPQAHLGYNIYLRDSDTGSFGLLNGTLTGTSFDAGFVWGTPDFGKLALETEYGLTSDAPCVVPKFGKECAYEWDHGALRLASILPGGEAVRATVGSSTGFECNFEHALSDDGNRLFFTSEEGASQGNIFAREGGTTSSLVTGSERGHGGMVGQQAWFQDAEAAHGNKVLFTTTARLVNADTDETRDLYMYDFTKPQGERLTLVSEDEDPRAPNGANVNPSGNTLSCGGLVAASEDLSRVYFVAENQIVGGAPSAPGPKLYMWEEDATPHTTYIATLGQSDVGLNAGIDLAPAVMMRGELGLPRQARWSADGRYLAFRSNTRLTPFDNEGRQEIYRYDALSGALDCVSCSSDAFPVEGGAVFSRTWVGIIKPVNHVPQNVSADGNVFFETTRGLVPGDSNGAQDVYEYENGRLGLISRGAGAEGSDFLDASPSGKDVFFTTTDRLVGWDKDQNADAYDARVNGGLPEPPPPPSSCEGEACLPAPVTPNDPTPASSSFEGAGNVSEAPRAGRCAKGKVKRHGRCSKKKPARRKHARQGKTTTRSHG